VEQFAALDGVTVNEWAEQAIIRCLPLSVKRNLLEKFGHYKPRMRVR
jgi:hypothetical protein